MTLISKCVTSGVVVGCANPVLVEMLGLESLSAAFSGVSALRGLAALLGNYYMQHLTLTKYNRTFVLLVSCLLYLVLNTHTRHHCRPPSGRSGCWPDPVPVSAHGHLRGCDGGGGHHGRGHRGGGLWPQAEDGVCQHGVTSTSHRASLKSQDVSVLHLEDRKEEQSSKIYKILWLVTYFVS